MSAGRAWPTVALEEICAPGPYAIAGGPFGSDLTRADYVESPGVPVIRGTNLGGDTGQFVDDGFVYVTDQKAVTLERNLARPGDLVFTQRGTLGQVAVIPTAARFPRYVVSQSQMKVAVDTTQADALFVWHYFRSPQAQRLLLRQTLATGVPHINLGILRQLTLPLPPLPEQRRIAALLDKAGAVRRKRQQAIRLADDLLCSAFLDMFGDPVTNPRGWPTATLADGIASIEAGWSAVGEDKPRRQDEWAVLKISAVTSGWFRPEEAKVVVGPVDVSSLVTPRRGDLLFSRANTRELVAATCLVDHDEPRLFLPDKLWRIVPRGDRCAGEFLRFLLANPAFRYEICRCATGTSGSMLNVSREKVLRLRAPFPPMPLQSRFRAAVWKTFSVRDGQILAEDAASLLLKCIVHRAFAG
jgi:type I restriction enzyme S subunit